MRILIRNIQMLQALRGAFARQALHVPQLNLLTSVVVQQWRYSRLTALGSWCTTGKPPDFLDDAALLRQASICPLPLIALGISAPYVIEEVYYVWGKKVVPNVCCTIFAMLPFFFQGVSSHEPIHRSDAHIKEAFAQVQTVAGTTDPKELPTMPAWWVVTTSKISIRLRSGWRFTRTFLVYSAFFFATRICCFFLHWYIQ